MVKNKDKVIKIFGQTAVFNFKCALHDFLSGICMGVAFIIPGFSGGSVAAILGIYEKMIASIATIFKNMLQSIVTLIPIALGLVAGALGFLFPLNAALKHFPLETVSLFVGLAIGSMPAVIRKVRGKKATAANITALTVPFIVTLVLCFVPMGTDVNLFGLSFGGYVLLFLIGIFGSCALVIPGISGSMLLLIIGYYNPIVSLITDHLVRLDNIVTCILVLAVFGLGIGIGFILVSVVMKWLLEKFPRGTYFAIIGFIVGSLPTVYISTMKDVGMLGASMSLEWLPESPLHYIACVLLLAAGILAAYAFVRYGDKIALKSKEENKTE